MDPVLAAKYPEIKSTLVKELKTQQLLFISASFRLVYKRCQLTLTNRLFYFEPYSTDLNTYTVIKIR
jgi:hypothetical protein